MSSSESTPRSSNRLIAAAVTVAAASLLVVVQFARMVEPAAARELTQACSGMRPADENPSFGALPTSEPVDFKAQDHTGKTVSLSDYRGKVVFVNFWATWCNVCDAEKPGLEDMAEKLGSHDFVILTLASDPGWDTVRDYLMKKFPKDRYPDGTAFNVLLDPPQGDDNLGPIARAFGISAVPETFVIDREGRVRYYFINKRDWQSDVARTCLRGVIDS